MKWHMDKIYRIATAKQNRQDFAVIVAIVFYPQIMRLIVKSGMSMSKILSGVNHGNQFAP